MSYEALRDVPANWLLLLQYESMITMAVFTKTLCNAPAKCNWAMQDINAVFLCQNRDVHNFLKLTARTSVCSISVFLVNIDLFNVEAHAPPYSQLFFHLTVLISFER